MSCDCTGVSDCVETPGLLDPPDNTIATTAATASAATPAPTQTHLRLAPPRDCGGAPAGAGNTVGGVWAGAAAPVATVRSGAVGAVPAAAAIAARPRSPAD